MDGVAGMHALFLRPAITVSNNCSHAIEMPVNHGFSQVFPPFSDVD
jgi:hypothetical protein